MRWEHLVPVVVVPQPFWSSCLLSNSDHVLSYNICKCRKTIFSLLIFVAQTEPWVSQLGIWYCLMYSAGPWCIPRMLITKHFVFYSLGGWVVSFCAAWWSSFWSSIVLDCYVAPVVMINMLLQQPEAASPTLEETSSWRKFHLLVKVKKRYL